MISDPSPPLHSQHLGPLPPQLSGDPSLFSHRNSPTFTAPKMLTAAHYLRHPPPLATSSLLPKPLKSFSLFPHLRNSPLPLFPLANFSLRPNIKHLACALPNPNPNPAKTLSPPFTFPPLPTLSLPALTPLTIIKWSAVLSLSLAAFKNLLSALLNPFFWMYFSWTWIFWPRILALLLAAHGLYCARQHSLGQATIFQQLSILTSAIAWLTLIPPAFFNGFLEGWPVVLFFVYHYFFFFESSVRRRLYGDLYARPHDPKWDVQLPTQFRIGFAVLVLVGHWLAAYEGPELQLISGGWANVGTWVLVALVLFMRYHSVLYLAKYSEKVAVPMEVVQFGPYRWVRHPIYASTMLLFALHCITLRAPLSLVFLMAVCVMYYGQKVELEEGLMAEKFGERYTEYAIKVRYKLIPLVY